MNLHSHDTSDALHLVTLHQWNEIIITKYISFILMRPTVCQHSIINWQILLQISAFFHAKPFWTINGQWQTLNAYNNHCNELRPKMKGVQLLEIKLPKCLWQKSASSVLIHDLRSIDENWSEKKREEANLCFGISHFLGFWMNGMSRK